jgi:hypothetical protein
MRESIKNWLVVFSLIIVVGVLTYFLVPNKIDEERSVLGTEDRSYKYAPYITSIAPLAVKVGEEYEYEIEVSDLDNSEDEIEFYLVQKPIWMYIEDNRVLGVPTEVGTYKFVVSVSDGINSTSQINYVLVEDE